MTIEAVLFDLDGTLVDTAPDLVDVLNDLLRERERAPMPYAIARNEVSNGAIGLIKLGFGTDCSNDELSALRARFLERYMKNICVNSILFSGLNDIFNKLVERGRRWGIVTNKPHAMTEALLEQIGIGELPACVIGGDRLPERKPHPAPLRLAAEDLGLSTARCIYVGDAPRDIEAGRAAGMRTVAAAYGYIRPAENPYGWGADAVVAHPSGLAKALAELDSTLQ